MKRILKIWKTQVLLIYVTTNHWKKLCTLRPPESFYGRHQTRQKTPMVRYLWPPPAMSRHKMNQLRIIIWNIAFLLAMIKYLNSPCIYVQFLVYWYWFRAMVTLRYIYIGTHAGLSLGTSCKQSNNNKQFKMWRM